LRAVLAAAAGEGEVDNEEGVWELARWAGLEAVKGGAAGEAYGRVVGG